MMTCKEAGWVGIIPRRRKSRGGYTTSGKGYKCVTGKGLRNV